MYRGLLVIYSSASQAAAVVNINYKLLWSFPSPFNWTEPEITETTNISKINEDNRDVISFALWNWQQIVSLGWNWREKQARRAKKWKSRHIFNSNLIFECDGHSEEEQAIILGVKAGGLDIDGRLIHKGGRIIWLQIGPVGRSWWKERVDIFKQLPVPGVLPRIYA